MSHRLRLDEPASDAVRGVVDERLERAVRRLNETTKMIPWRRCTARARTSRRRAPRCGSRGRACRRAELQADAFETGRRLYAEKPKAFARRLAGYLAAAREDVALRTAD